MDRRTFLAGALATPVAASLPLPALSAPAPLAPVIMTGSVAWGATADEMIAELLDQRMKEAEAMVLADMEWDLYFGSGTLNAP